MEWFDEWYAQNSDKNFSQTPIFEQLIVDWKKQSPIQGVVSEQQATPIFGKDPKA